MTNRELPRTDLTGNAFLSASGVWYSRVSLGAGQRLAFALPWARPEQATEAHARAGLMARIARTVRLSKEPSTIALLPTMLSDAANAAEPKDLAAIESMVGRLTSELLARGTVTRAEATELVRRALVLVGSDVLFAIIAELDESALDASPMEWPF